MKKNPPWVDALLTENLPSLKGQVPSDWLPSFKEYGCGSYGCVVPTQHEGIVLKITSDVSEGEFVRFLIENELDLPGFVKYFKLAIVTGKNEDGKQMKLYLLWREEAHQIGKTTDAMEERLSKLKKVGDLFTKFVATEMQSKADALEAYRQAFNIIYVEKAVSKKDTSLAGQLAYHIYQYMMALRDCYELPSLREIAESIFQLTERHIFVTDMHGGNVGVVDRDGEAVWVVTDPGNVLRFHG